MVKVYRPCWGLCVGNACALHTLCAVGKTAQVQPPCMHDTQKVNCKRLLGGPFRNLGEPREIVAWSIIDLVYET
jgi:hypothetical protein